MFYLKDASADKTPIYLIATYKKIRFKYSTGESINPAEWRKENFRSTNKAVNAVLDRHENLYHRLIDSAKLNNITVDRDYLFSGFEKEFKHTPRGVNSGDFFKMIDFFIKETESGNRTTRNGTRVVPARIKQYRAFENKLKGYKSEINVNDIDLNFYKGYIAHRNKLNKAKNSIGSEISILKAILKFTNRAGLHSNRVWDNDDFRTFDEDVENVFLSDGELDTLWELKTLTPKKEKVRDLFLIGCYTGLRIADLSKLDNSNIEGNLLKVITGKTGEIVYIPIHARVKTLLKKYSGFPESISDVKMNKYIKLICKEAKFTKESNYKKTVGGKIKKYKQKKYKRITNHTARRTFATNLYLAGFDTLSIMKITGHTTEKSFMKYICVTQREMANKMVSHPYFM